MAKRPPKDSHTIREDDMLAVPGKVLPVARRRHKRTRDLSSLVLEAMCAQVDTIWARQPPDHHGPLRVAYTIPGRTVTGGMKMLMEHIRHLRARGHHVRAVAVDDRRGGVMPDWTDVRADEEIVLHAGQPIWDALQNIDVVVPGWFHQIPELAGGPVPVLYWEQGHEFLFGDVPNEAVRHWKKRFDEVMAYPVALAGVSPVVQEILAHRYGRRSGLVLNGIDTVRFHPGTRPHRNRVLLIGNPRLAFKGFDVAMRVLEKVYRVVGNLEVTWISQVPVKISGNKFPIKWW